MTAYKVHFSADAEPVTQRQQLISALFEAWDFAEDAPSPVRKHIDAALQLAISLTDDTRQLPVAKTKGGAT